MCRRGLQIVVGPHKLERRKKKLAFVAIARSLEQPKYTCLTEESTNSYEPFPGHFTSMHSINVKQTYFKSLLIIL